MKDKKSNNKSKLSKILLFPEKLNSILIFFSIIIFSLITILIISYCLPKPNLDYIPEYEEGLFSDYVNNNLRVINNYSYETVLNDKGEEIDGLKQKTTIISCYFGASSSNKVDDFQGSYVYELNDKSLLYRGDKIRSTSETYSSTSYISNDEKLKNTIKTIYGKFSYSEYINGKKGSKKCITFKEDLLSLSNDEINMNEVNDFENIKTVIKTVNITHRKDKDKQYFKSTVNIDKEKGKYHFDYQLFGIANNKEVYNLLGYYNVSNSYSTYLSNEAYAPEDFEFDSVILKVKIITEDNQENIYYLKSSIDNLK